MKPLTNCTDSELVIMAQKIEERFRKALEEAKAISEEYGFDIGETTNVIQTIVFSKLKEKRDLVTKENVEPVFKSSLETLSKKGEFAKMTELLSLYSEGKYKEVKTQLEELGLFHIAKERRRNSSDSPKAPAKKLKVTFPDGNVICYDKASDTLVAVVDFIGLENVQQLGWNVSGAPFVSDNPTISNGQYPITQKAFKGKFITTHSNTSSKSKLIKKLSDLFGLDLTVEIV